MWRIKMNSPGSESLHNLLSEACRKRGLKLILEYKFLVNRKFRFDFAVVQSSHSQGVCTEYDEDIKIAFEFEGATWTNGRHTRGSGYLNDVEKYNLAALHGWRLFRFTSDDFKVRKSW